MTSLTHPEDAHHVKKGSTIMLKGHPVKISDVKTSKTGKHGHAKCNMTGSCILCNKKCNEVYPGHIIVGGIVSIKNEYEVADLVDGVVSAMDADGNELQFNLESCGCPQAVNEADFKAEIEAFQANALAGGEKFWLITVVNAPVGEPGKESMATQVIEFKEGKGQ
jgi:translation initiation factor 5A